MRTWSNQTLTYTAGVSLNWHQAFGKLVKDEYMHNLWLLSLYVYITVYVYSPEEMDRYVHGSTMRSRLKLEIVQVPVKSTRLFLAFWREDQVSRVPEYL